MKDLSKFRFSQLPVLFFLIYIVIHFTSCCKCDDPSNVECPNYDPCTEINNPQASFGAGFKLDFNENELFNGFYPDTSILFDGDTIAKTCTFYSHYLDVDSFYWKIGQDPRIFRESEVFLVFEDIFHYQPINVELVVEKKNSCFQNGFMRDTFKRVVVPDTKVFDSPSYIYFTSSYRGTSSEFPDESIEIEFRDDSKDIFNMPKGENGKQTIYRRDYLSLIHISEPTRPY